MEDELKVEDIDIIDILDIEDDVSETLRMKDILKVKSKDVAILEDRVDEINEEIEETETRVETIEEQVQAINSNVSTLSKEIKRVEKIKPKVIEKVIERTETIVEKPIITNEIKEVAVADTAQEIVNKINTLDPNKEEEKIDAKHIKNRPEFSTGR